MNAPLLIIGYWFGIFLFFLILNAMLFSNEEINKYGKAMVLLSAIITSAIVLIIGGLFL